MMRVRIPGGQLAADQLRAIAEASPRSTAATWPTSPTGRTSSSTGSGSRTSRPSGSGWTRSACPASRPAATCRATSSAARWRASTPPRSWTPRGAAGDRGGRDQQPGPDQPAAQVQDRDLRLREPVHRARGQRRLLRRRHRAGRHARLRPVGRRRPVHQPDAGASGSAPSCRPTGCRRSGPASPALFRDYGYRRLRSRARLKFLVADWGAERFREVLETRVPRRERAGRRAGAARAVRPGSRDHIGVHRQRDGRYYVGVAPHTGRTSGTQLWQVADLAEALRLRPGPAPRSSRSC